MLSATPADPVPLVFFDDNLHVWIAGDSTGSRFLNGKLLGNWNRTRNWEFHTGDFNGDGREDVLGRAEDGEWQLELNLDGFDTQSISGADVGLQSTLDWTRIVTGDFNGDATQDIAGLTPEGIWQAAIATNDGFALNRLNRIGTEGYTEFLIGDFNQDGIDDIANFNESGHWWVTQSDSDTFRNVYRGRIAPVSFAQWHNFHVGDFNGDQYPDFLFQDRVGRWWVGENTHTANFLWLPQNRWSMEGFVDYRIGDFNGDGLDDVAGRYRDNGWFLNLSQPGGKMALGPRWAKWNANFHVTAITADIDANGTDDLVGWFPETGVFWANYASSTGSTQSYFGRFDPAVFQIRDRPGLSRVLVMGDSISIGYTIPLRESLAEQANVHRVFANAGDTEKGLAQIPLWLGLEPWDVIVFNFGLHDLKYVDDDGNLVDVRQGEQVTPLHRYTAILERIVRLLKETGARLIWANTTVVPDGSLGRIAGDEMIYNQAAAGVINAHGIETLDLHTLTSTTLQQYQRPRDVHFTLEGSQELGKFIGERVSHVLTELTEPAVPSESESVSTAVAVWEALNQEDEESTGTSVI